MNYRLMVINGLRAAETCPLNFCAKTTWCIIENKLKESEDLKMKNLNKVRIANSKTLEFKNKEEMWKFLFSINEILVPYSEESIRIAKGKDEMTFWMKRGIKIDWWPDENLVDILVKAEDFRKIEHLFRKEHLRSGKNKFVFKGFEEA